ncbi:Two-component response regulator, YesN/AraC family, consists of REC and AraC-type DNA-binding domains [Paenibacillus sp. 1_12]|uniref:response regulator transcription factor n=1 Tax=Paenibacillus sp. 1_12 TaxID=1566278 RepID=UPI0008F1AAC1|nr:response regulator [Paenibacillus sp. 1_12]SFK97507.1 Two-component response regulator, YesN/AraC family, consists of REC and AraC-type DNA-binding domains [Paenibacillus sp. 1_12]
MNIFLVEDEYWALAEMVELFKSYEPEHHIYAFENGDDVLTVLDQVRPNLVLTDINMPGIDGLELIEKLNQLDPNIMSMIVSVHDEFEYARVGMKFGVIDYLLKPVKKDILFKAVDQAILHIEKESKRREEWINGSITQMLLAEEIPDYDILHSMNTCAYCMVLIAMDKGSNFKGWKATSVSWNDLRQKFANKSAIEVGVYCVDLDCWHKVVLIPLPNVLQMSDIKEKLSSLYEQLRSLPFPIHMGFAVKSEQNSLYGVCSELRQRLDKQMTFGMSTWLPPESKMQDAELGSVWEKVRVMELHYKKGDMLKGSAALKLILEDLRLKQVTRRQLQLFIHDLLFSLKYNVLASKLGMVSVHDLQEDVRLLNRLVSYTELFEWLNESIVSIYCEKEIKDFNPKGLVPVLLQLIHNHFQGSISLQQFAADHHVSLGYLSRIFKSQTGHTFSEYITNYRISKAKELLTGGVERLQEISSLVGYEDPRHFSALFKRIVGETPITYAKRHAGKTTGYK